MKYRCKTHNITLTVEGNERKYDGLKWDGAPQCALFTMKEVREGAHGECRIESVK